MKAFFQKLFTNAGVRKALIALVVALAAAVGISEATGCAALQADPRVAQATCVARALDGVNPETLTLGQARELAAALQACREPVPAADAGTE